MPIYDLRILLETVEGNKTSYYSSGSDFLPNNFINTDTENNFMSASMVRARINRMVSASYQNETIFTGEVVNGAAGSINYFSGNTLLSASLSGSTATGSIVFTALDSDYDRLLRYKFIGEKVTNVLGLPSDQWVYVDQVRLPVDDEANVFQGNANLGNVSISDTLTFAGGSDINSDVPILIDTGSDRYIKFVDERGISEVALRMGYDADTDIYEITGSPDFTFKIGGVDTLDGNITSSTFLFQENVDGGDTTIRIFNTNTDSGTDKGAGIEFKHATNAVPAMKPAGKIIAGKDSGYASAGGTAVQDSNLQFFTALNGTDTERLRIDSNGLAIFTGDISASGDLIVEGSIQATQITSSIVSSSIIFSSGSNIFGDADDDTHTFNGHITASGNISASGDVFATRGNFPTSVNTPTIASGDTTEVHINDNLKVTGNITASGNISASGEVSANTIVVGDTITHIGDSNTKITFSDDDINLTAAGKTAIDITYDGDGGGDTREITFNEGHADIDVRIEGDADTDLFFTNAGTDRVGVGTNSPSSKLQVDGDFTATNITASGNISASGTVFANAFSSPGGDGDIDFSDSLDVSGNITASGNISSSGIITGEGLVISDDAEIADDLTVKGTLHITSSTDPNLILEDPNGSNVLRFRRTDQNKNFDISMQGNDLRIISTDDDGSQNVLIGVNSGGTPRDNRLGLGVPNPTERLSVFGNVSISGSGMGHITASGNISASGANSTFGEVVNLVGEDPRLRLKAIGANHPGIEWHEDSTRKWVLYNDPDESDKLVFKNDSTELVKINQAGATEFPSHITASGNISASGYISSSGVTISEQGDLRLIGGANDIIFGQPGDTTSQNYGIKTDGNLYLDIDKDNDNTGNFFQFRSNAAGTNIMRIKDTGEVGIGTTSPSNALHIVTGSGTNLTPALKLQKEVDGDGSATGILLGAVNAGQSKGGIFFENKGISSGRGSLHFASNEDSDTSEATIADARMTIIDGGNVGIGTTSPSDTLHVAGTMLVSGSGADGNSLFVSGGRIGIQTASPEKQIHLAGATSQLYFAGTAGGAGGGIVYKDSGGVARYSLFFPGSNVVALANRGSNGRVDIRANDSTAGSGGEKIVMSITGSERVGIRTTNPTETLDVSGSMNISGPGHITASGDISGSKDSFLTVGRHGTFGHATSTNTGQVKIVTRAADNSQLVLASAGNSHTMVRRPASTTDMALLAGDGERVRILADGNVGIGTTTPTKKLQVEGNISSSGAINTLSHITASGRLTIGDVANFNGSFVNIGGGFGSTGVSIADDGDIQTDGTLEVKSATYTSSFKVSQADGAVNGVTQEAGENGGGWARAYNFSTGSTHRWGGYGGFGGKGTFSYFYIGKAYNDHTMTIMSSSKKVGIGNTAPTSELTVEGDISASGNLNIQGSITATSITSSFVTSSVVLTEGSTQFGDASGDTHTFIGNITASGNISASGEIAGLSLDINGTSNFADDITIAEGKKIIFDSTDTFIQANTDNPEDLQIAADEDIFLSPDDDLFIQHGSTTYVTFGGDERKVTINGALNLSQSAGIGSSFEAPTTAVHTLRFDSQRFRFWAGGSERLTILSASGNVGIGKDSPTETLELGAGGRIKVTPGTDATGSILSLANDHDVLFSSQNDSATGDPQQFVLKHNAGDTELINRRGDLILSASTDRVGVGTNAPTYALHVSGSELRLQKAGNDAIITSRTDGAGAYFIADSQNANYAGFQINHSGGGAWFLGGYNSADFNIVDGPRNTGFKQFVVKNSNGNVEIRTGSLHLIGQDGGHITASGNYSGSANSTFRIGGKLIAGSKSFVIDRPEGGKLEYGVLEGQQNDVFFRGELKGDNVIYLPQEWEWLVDDNTITVQLTSIGKHQELFVKEIKDNKIFIDINGICKSKKDIHCYHIIHGTRKDVELIRNYQ